jgi:glucose-6-phosphate isomerase
MSTELWQRYCEHVINLPELGFSLDVSRVRFGTDYLSSMTARMKRGLEAMEALEGGAIANADEGRMVGHYWLRAAERAPTPAIAREIKDTLTAVKEFTRGIHQGTIRVAGGPFEHVLVVGIGGSCLGPQFVARALSSESDALKPHFLDNTDPDGIGITLGSIRDALDRTLVIVISKSGGTPETRNGMLLVEEAFKSADLTFARHAVAITQEGSKLDQHAVGQGWLARFPMWDWVGGRTSELSAVGLLPAALQGIDIDEMLLGAATMDRLTREPIVQANPAAMLALMWYHLGQGCGAKDMVVLPYKDRLELFSRYLQQLVMESLGKELDRQSKVVHQGLAVYGNKGSTDQHAYVQQLRDGLNNFFAIFIEVLGDRGSALEVEPGVTAGDYLSGFHQGTRSALYDNQRDSITITLDEVRPSSVGALIALFERAVGLYAELIDVNAYHQPGVEAGKKAAAAVLEVQSKLVAYLGQHPEAKTAQSLATAIGLPAEVETVYRILRHLAANPGRGVASQDGPSPDRTTFRATT